MAATHRRQRSSHPNRSDLDQASRLEGGSASSPAAPLLPPLRDAFGGRKSYAAGAAVAEMEWDGGSTERLDSESYERWKDREWRSEANGVLSEASSRPVLLFDISDLVYYLGHHPNLSGIQRVQAGILLGLIQAELYPARRYWFISYDTRNNCWLVIERRYMGALLKEMFAPVEQRRIKFDMMNARHGILPNSTPLAEAAVLEGAPASVLCLLGAAWVRRDYFHEILELKRKFGTRFVMCLHDLIPIYARETCDQGTAKVFEQFIRRALRHADCFLAVSENTAADLGRYTASLKLPEPNVVVTGNGSSFAEFMPALTPPKSFVEGLPTRFVLFVATIEGRKNHRFMLEIWRELHDEGLPMPHLICVGRLGWKSEGFLSDLIESDFLRGRVVLMQDVSDAELHALYERCLFTVFPSLYEGWGLPVGESLAAGKVCVLSDRASLPEVGGDLGLYIDVADKEQAKQVIRRAIADEGSRTLLEQRIRSEYRPVSWVEVAGRVVAACEQNAALEWRDAYPFPMVDFGAEISFARLERDLDGVFGDELLGKVALARQGLLLPYPLAESAFLRGEEARVGPGWTQPEDWGTWMRYPGAELAFYLPPTRDESCYVFLLLRATKPVHEVPLEITANTVSVWTGRIGDERTVCCRVRSKPTAGGPWKLELKFRVPVDPAIREEIAAIDGRFPSIGISRLVVINRSDIVTRLELLQNVVMRD